MPSVTRKEYEWSKVEKGRQSEDQDKRKLEGSTLSLELLHSQNKFAILHNLNSSQKMPTFQKEQPSAIQDKNKNISEKERRIKRIRRSCKVQSSDIKPIVIQKIKKVSPVETSNPFQILEETSEEDIFELSKRAKILGTSRKHLKKCKYCTHKKRKCNLHPEKCIALKKICQSCKTMGHFPKSRLCRLNKKNKKDKFEKKNTEQALREKESHETCEKDNKRA